MRTTLVILLLSLSLNSFAQEGIYETYHTEERAKIEVEDAKKAALAEESLSLYDRLVRHLTSTVVVDLSFGLSKHIPPSGAMTEAEYRAKIDQGAKFIIYDIRSDLLIKNWGK